MPKPLAICIEDLAPASEAERFLRCVAVPGRQPGLRLDEKGAVLWQSEEEAVELWVSADERLVLYRPEGSAATTVRRGERSLAAPAEKPVILIDQDEIDVGARRLRIHVHGEAPEVAAPSPLVPETQQSGPLGRLARAAAAVALGSVMAAGCGEVEVRVHPPKPKASTPTPTFDVSETQPKPSPPPSPTIEVRDQPPLPTLPPPPPSPPIDVRDMPTGVTSSPD